MRSLDETLNVLQDELRVVEAQLSEPDVADDLTRLRDLSRRHKELSDINVAWLELRGAQDDLATAREMFNETEGSTASSGVKWSIPPKPALWDSKRTRNLAPPSRPQRGAQRYLGDPRGRRGEEANLFAADLAEMYRRYAALRGWKLEVIEERRV